MNEPVINITEKDQIILLTIDRQEALNALNKAVFDAFFNFFTGDYAVFTNARGVIITGSGNKAFAAGADIKELQNLSSDRAEELSRRGQEIFQLIENFHLPVIAAINGFALGGGLELAMACHMRVASERARFGMPELKLGIIPGYHGTKRLGHLVGKSKAMEIILTGDMFDASEAKNLGLINHITPSGEELIKANEIHSKIKLQAPLAIKAAIHSINEGGISEATYFGSLATTADFKEGVDAFINKRLADFKGY